MGQGSFALFVGGSAEITRTFNEEITGSEDGLGFEIYKLDFYCEIIY
ncbi:hypothetical protein EVA_14094, partial [gut metagenome]